MSIRRDAPDCRDETIVISFGSGSAASTSKILQSPIQKCSVHSGPEVQRPCRNYFKVPSRSAAFIRVRKCSVHVEIISKSDPEVQRSFGSGSAASMSKLFQSPIQKYSVHSGPEVQRPCRNYFKVRSRSTAFIRVRKCSVHVEIISKSDPEVQRSFGSGSAASMSKVLQSPIQKCSVHSCPEVQRPRRNYCKVPSRSAAFVRVQKCSVHVEIISKSKKKNWRHSNNMNTYSPIPKRKKQK
jgi:hypothetical protein